ncbi:MAG: hypothetical protein LQ350_002003 [Teloschistes chrysophthalmus]|nr:MAG: hypothetical protein LQ350_002003 [Niorma chrysophthalma]
MTTSPALSLVVAISGLSSTGKSTVASYLPSIFQPPNFTVTILHVDDFYKAQVDLPKREGLLDWDCADSLDWPRLEDAVQRWKAGEEVNEGQTNPQPNFTVGGEEGGSGNPAGITQDLLETLRGEVTQAVTTSVPAKEPQRILLLDGFLLFTPSAPSTFRSLLDLKILLRAPYAEAKRRRETRSGYDTMEGWWEDPPGYFDKVVWPNYVEENRGFFVRGDVDGEVDVEVCKREKVRIKKGDHGALGEVLKWVVAEVRGVAEKEAGPHGL